jgi:hypothetical protein
MGKSPEVKRFKVKEKPKPTVQSALFEGMPEPKKDHQPYVFGRVTKPGKETRLSDFIE